MLMPIVTAALASGCAGKGPAAVAKPEIDAQAVADRALEKYDDNSDGSLDKEELAKCPPFVQTSASYDADNDGRVTGDEISARLAQLCGPASAYVTADCTVTFDRRPLVGAVVKLRPLDIFSDSLPPAEGTTDEGGTARPKVAADRLPVDLGDAILIFPGVYHVEITHPKSKLPARYNTATELGWQVDPSSRTGLSMRFDLTSK